mgnify:CR=1 FL=1
MKGRAHQSHHGMLTVYLKILLAVFLLFFVGGCEYESEIVGKVVWCGSEAHAHRVLAVL